MAREFTFTLVQTDVPPGEPPVMRLVAWDIDEETRAQSVFDIKEGNPRWIMNEFLSDLHARGFLPEEFRVRTK